MLENFLYFLGKVSTGMTKCSFIYLHAYSLTYIMFCSEDKSRKIHSCVRSLGAGAKSKIKELQSSSVQASMPVRVSPFSQIIL